MRRPCILCRAFFCIRTIFSYGDGRCHSEVNYSSIELKMGVSFFLKVNKT